MLLINKFNVLRLGPAHIKLILWKQAQVLRLYWCSMGKWNFSSICYMLEGTLWLFGNN